MIKNKYFFIKLNEGCVSCIQCSFHFSLVTSKIDLNDECSYISIDFSLGFATFITDDHHNDDP